jgi:hypothetical protein
MLVSHKFLISDFIKHIEVPRLRQRQEKDKLRIVPFLLQPCAWQTQSWLEPLQMVIQARGEALSEVAVRGPAEVDKGLASFAAEIAALIGAKRSSPPPPLAKRPSSVPAPDLAAAIELMKNTTFRAHGSSAARELASQAAGRLAALTGWHGANLFDAARFCIEHHLLNAPDLSAPLVPDETSAMDPHTYAGRTLSELRKRIRTGMPGDPITVTSRFFARTREREEDWRQYFIALTRHSTVQFERFNVASLCRVRCLGFLVPQFLVAGLLARFEDDWEPVLNAYAMAIPPARLSTGVFESVQASQWNCWLVWGPSIPFCTCDQWQGACAFQYGYGDENNSLPVIDVQAPDLPRRALLNEVVTESQTSGQLAKLSSLVGHLRWAPWLLRESMEQTITDDQDSEADPFHAWEEMNSINTYTAASAQRTLYVEEAHPRRNADGLILHVNEIFRPTGRAFQDSSDVRKYFSAYRWAIFLVALADQDGEVGPKLLFKKPYPAWPQTPADRAAVKAAKLWEDLLPVFVHANIADAPAVQYQTEALADAALGLLRQIWQSRQNLFHKDDVAAGIRFYLVCSSDFSGCGCPIRYPSPTALAQLLAARTTREPDADFARAIVLPPPDRPGNERPWGLRGFFSSCHLSELVADYYECVPKERQRKTARVTTL